MGTIIIIITSYPYILVRNTGTTRPQHHPTEAACDTSYSWSLQSCLCAHAVFLNGRGFPYCSTGVDSEQCSGFQLSAWETIRKHPFLIRDGVFLLPF